MPKDSRGGPRPMIRPDDGRRATIHAEQRKLNLPAELNARLSRWMADNPGRFSGEMARLIDEWLSKQGYKKEGE